MCWSKTRPVCSCRWKPYRSSGNHRQPGSQPNHRLNLRNYRTCRELLALESPAVCGCVCVWAARGTRGLGGERGRRRGACGSIRLPQHSSRSWCWWGATVRKNRAGSWCCCFMVKKPRGCAGEDTADGRWMVSFVLWLALAWRCAVMVNKTADFTQQLWRKFRVDLFSCVYWNYWIWKCLVWIHRIKISLLCAIGHPFPPIRLNISFSMTLF